MNVEPTSDVIGAHITGVDIEHGLDDPLFDRIEQEFQARSVVCIREQSLTPAGLLAFARRFGEPDVHFMRHYAHPEHQNILVVSNIQENGRDIGYADAGRVWHSDGSYLQTPVAVTMLYALEVPEEAGVALGATQFASAWAAYDALPDELKVRISRLRAVHQVAGRREKTGTGLKDRAQEQAMPEVEHPLVRVHPDTGREYIFVSAGECRRVVGLDELEGAALIERLAEQVQAPAFRHVHRWQVGDLLVWDNRAVQHLASFDYQWPRHRRLMHRVTITEGTGRC